MNKHLAEVDRYNAAARLAIAAQRAVLETLEPDGPEASELSKHLAMSEDALQELLDLREFIARVIELGKRQGGTQRYS
jgi:hypothetical protein